MLKILLSIIIFYYCIRLLSPIIARFFLKRWINKMHRDLRKRNSPNNEQNHKDYRKYQEGDTEVSYKKDKNINPDGEYVDFEDLNDDV